MADEIATVSKKCIQKQTLCFCKSDPASNLLQLGTFITPVELRRREW